MKRIFIPYLLLTLLFACKTDVDTNAPWKETAVIYGLIDAKLPYQTFKISKTYQNGSGNALDYAKIADSIYYKPDQLDIQLLELDSLGQATLRTIGVKAIELNSKSDGIFVAPYQILYQTDSFSVKKSSWYKLVVKNKTSGYTAEATTKVVNDFCVISPTPLPSFFDYCTDSLIPLAPVQIENRFGLRWRGSANAEAYKIKMGLHYKEIIKTRTDTAYKYIETVVNNSYVPSDNRDRTETIEGDVFFNMLKTNINTASDSPDLLRYVNGIQFTIYASGKELKTYIDVNNSSFSAVTQVQPFYTNIVNGAGIFSSRISKTKRAPLSKTTVQAIMLELPELKFAE